MCKPLEIKRQQAFQNFVIGYGGRVVGPAVSSCHGYVKLLVRMGEPLWAQVVQVGERALLQRFQISFADALLRFDAIWVGAFVHAQGDDFGHCVRPFRRVQPVVAQVVESFGGVRDVDGQLPKAGLHRFAGR